MAKLSRAYLAWWIRMTNTLFYTIDIIPGLYKTYPNAAMQISLAATAAPVVSISPSGIDLLAGGELDIQVLLSPNNPINALSFSIKTENVIKVRIRHSVENLVEHDRSIRSQIRRSKLRYVHLLIFLLYIDRSKC